MLLAATVGASAAFACSSTYSLHLRFLCTLPIASEKFFVTGVKVCQPEPVPPAAPGTTGDAESYRVSPTPGGLDVRASFSGKRCRLQATGWYDVNGDGAVDPGDYVASIAPVEISEGSVGSDPARPLEVELEAVTQ